MKFKKKEILLIGAGSHSRSCIEVIESIRKFTIIGLVGSVGETGNKVLGHEVLGTDEQLHELSKEYQYAHISIGQIGDATKRRELFDAARQFGFILPTLISSLAHVSHSASVGMGTIVMHGAIINSASKIGENCIVNTRALIEHDVSIGNNCHISTGSIINGNVSVGDETFVGSGSVVRNSVNISSNVFIGMQERVVSDLAYGARFIGGNEL
jgi:sugar O-acyltransferase (sialic acid O-acetyltransferase NeuD family)